MKGGTTKGEIIKRGGFCRNNSHKNNCLNSFCFFSVICGTQKFLFMVVFMNSILNLILKWFLRKNVFHQIYIISAILFLSNGKKLVNKKFIYHKMTYVL